MSNITTNSNVILTNSDIAIDNNIKNKLIATKSNLATKSNIASQSVIKGDIDIYGNIIEYDPNDWVGEDHVLDRNININNIFTKDNEEEFGTLDIFLAEDLTYTKSNVLLSLVDEAYNIHNIYIYYRNDYHEKVDLAPGVYKVNNVLYLADDKINIEASEGSIIITKDETTNITINRTKSEIIYSTISEIKESEEVKENSREKMPLYIYILIILAIIIFMVAVLLVVKRFVVKKDE